MGALYKSDFYTWAVTQGDALRRRSVNEVDWDNVAEEIETLGRSEARELRSRYAILLIHLLKWRFEPGFRSPSWQATINGQRIEIEELLLDSPGLKPHRDELLASAYRSARANAATETGFDIDVFPDTNPFTLAQAMDEAFWPEG